jgi:hypothetical protein
VSEDQSAWWARPVTVGAAVLGVCVVLNVVFR